MLEKHYVELIEKAVHREDISLPIFNQVAIRLQQLLTRGDYSLADISKIIHRDQGLASDVLKMANAAFYAGLKPAKTIQDATVRLGARTIYNLVTAVTQKQLYRARKREFDQWMKPLWSHSLGVAFASRWLSLHLGKPKIMEESFMAGLLHDIGKLFLLKVIEDLDKFQPLHEKEASESLIDEILRAMHAQYGERLMKRMNMPEIYCYVARMHHDPEIEADNLILNMVRLGNLACHKIGIGINHNPELILATTPEATAVGATELLLDELHAKLEEYMDWASRFLGSK
jgi:HD-like signal output (HDOD) protein